MFLRRKGLFATVFALVCLAGGAYLALSTPLYLSSASLVLHFDSQAVPDIDRSERPRQLEGTNEHREVLYSDADMLHSVSLVHRVIDTIGLGQLYPKIASSNETPARKMDLAEQAFSNDLVVDVGTQSDLLNVSFLHENPNLAQAAMQQLLDQFYSQEAAVYANPQLHFAEAEAKSAQQKLTTAQKDLSDFKASNKIADLPQQVSELLKSRTDVESRLQVAQGHVLEAQQREDALKQLLQTVPETQTMSAQGEQYQAADAAEAQLDQLRAKRSQMAATYRPDSTVFQSLDAQISALSSAVGKRTGEAKGRTNYQPNVVYQSIRTDFLRAHAEATSAKQPVDVLTQQLQQMNDRLNQLESQQSRYDDLVRNVAIQNDTYKSLAIRYETARVEANRNAQRISAAVVIATPSMPTKPARPRRKLVALGTVLAALLLATGSVLAIEAFDDRLRAPRDVTQYLRLPVLATFERDA